MKILNIIITKHRLFPILFMLTLAKVHAQKLPTEQKASLRAPANIKIDGKAAEWDNKFEAYSNHTQFFYTLANDDNNLYLTIQATDPVIIKRILRGSITFTINKSGSKKDKAGIHITYPLLNNFTVPLKNPRARITGIPPVTEGDSLMNASNKRMNEASKEIKVLGIKNIDTLISVYNTVGIKAAAAFDNKMIYTSELSISLKTLGLSVTNPAKFAYQLMINPAAASGMVITNNPDGGIRSISITGPNAAASQEATDQWGDYTLAK
jgi:hypothetical protein